jgi:hypothetical protein
MTPLEDRVRQSLAGGRPANSPRARCRRYGGPC